VTEQRLQKSDWQIKPIDYKEAMDIVVRNHYLHRKAPCSFAFGLFKGDLLHGVICYGTPSSAPLRRGIAGDEHTHNVIELTRLWVDDIVPKNGESYLIGNTLKLVDKEIIVSYADTSHGHLGTVYQATNWLYSGLSAKRTDWVVEGLDKHSQTIADKYTAQELRDLYGDRFTLRVRPRKHRYIYINAKGKRRSNLIAALKYPLIPYPKDRTLEPIIITTQAA
jgi:hypothetical protein